MDLLVLDTAIPYKRMSTLKKHITDFGTFPHFILTCIKICFSLLLQYVCRFDVSQMSILKFEINSKVGTCGLNCHKTSCIRKIE
jgi:hypothetical protein